jgi:transposase
MIAPPANARIWIAAGVTDLRRGFGGLSALVQTVLEQDPYAGHVFVFRGRRGDLIKLLWWDGDGLCLFAKRLERGRFVWPKMDSGTVALTRAQLSMLLEGIDWERRETDRRYRVKVPCNEGVAIHIDPESCAGSRKAAREALTGVHLGQVLSAERLHIRSVDAFQSAEDNTAQSVIASADRLRGVWRPWHVCTSSVGNREVSILPLASRVRGRTVKAGGRRL